MTRRAASGPSKRAKKSSCSPHFGGRVAKSRAGLGCRGVRRARGGQPRNTAESAEGRGGPLQTGKTGREHRHLSVETGSRAPSAIGSNGNRDRVAIGRFLTPNRSLLHLVLAI